MAKSSMRRYPGRRVPISVEAPADVLESLSWFLNVAGEEAPTADDRGEPDLRLRETADGFLLEGAYVSPETAWCDNGFAAAQLLADAITRLAALQHHHDMLLHSASIAVEGQLLVLLGDSMAGKSTVALSAAARGWQLFGDDRIGLSLAGTRAEGFAAGLQPKIRLPLPPDSTKLFTRFVATVTLAEAADIAYLRLGHGRLAPMGSRRPVAAIFQLSRKQGDGRAVLGVPLEPPAALRALLRHSYAPQVAAKEHLERCAALAESVPIFDLRFSRSESVIGYLTRARDLWQGDTQLKSTASPGPG